MLGVAQALGVVSNAMQGFEIERDGELYTGEERLEELKRELKDLLAIFEDEATIEKIKALYLAEYQSKSVENDDRYYENLNPQGIARQLKRLLHPAFYGDFFRLFATQNREVLNRIDNQDAVSEQDIQDVAEALAVILLSNPEDLDDDLDGKNGGDNTRKADGEGARIASDSNLKDAADVIKQLIAQSSSESGRAREGFGQSTLEQLLKSEQDINEQVQDSQQDQELSQAAIRKANRA